MRRNLLLGIAVLAAAVGVAICLVMSATVPLPSPRPSREVALSHFLYVMVVAVLVGGLDSGVLAVVRRRARAARSNRVDIQHSPASATSSAEPVQAGRPMGRLITADGRSYPVAGALIIGRNLDDEPAVTQGKARAIEIAGSDGVSRRHAQVHVAAGSVLLSDLGSTNGTRWRAAGASEWTRVTAGQPVRIEPGCTIAVGDFEIHYESQEPLA
jgi:hypothetical protein